MLWQLIAPLADRLGACSLGVAIGGAIIGVALWLAGARFSRSLVTLMAVAIGTSVGVRLPGWLGWNIDGMAIGVGGAVLLGASGYLLHRTWIGMYLALLLAVWAGVGSWMALDHGATMRWPSINWNGGIAAASQAVWTQMTFQPIRGVAIAAGIGLLAGVVMTIFWPKLSGVTTWSLAGVTLMLSMLAAAGQMIHLSWVGALGVSGMIQGTALLGLVVLGASIQWLIMPRAKAAGQNQLDFPTLPVLGERGSDSIRRSDSAPGGGVVKQVLPMDD